MILRSNGEFLERRSSGFTSCQAFARPTFESSKAKLHSPFRLVQSWRRTCGRGYSGRGIKLWSPFLLEMWDIHSAWRKEILDGAVSLSKWLGTLGFRPGKLKAKDLGQQMLEVLQVFCPPAYLPRDEVSFHTVGGECP